MTRPVVITGMHRSGTSMVARAAHALGLYLGHPDDLVPAAPDNPDGFFEHAGLVAASDTLFQDLGGGWDCPPTLGPADLAGPGLTAARDLARPVLDELATHGSWAWKDPRVAPVLPFWLDLVSDLGVVLCLRNPLEVAASLRARNGTSLALGLRLWVQHTDAAVAGDGPRLVTHYDAWFHRPDEEVARLAAFAGLDPDPERVTAAAGVPARHLRHARFDAPSLRTAGAHPGVRELYERLCIEAGWADGAAALVATNGDARPAEPVALTSGQVPLGQVRPWVVDVGLARYEVHKRNGRVAQLERQLAPREPSNDPVGGSPAADPEPGEDVRASIYDLQLQVAELTARVVHGIDAESRATDVAYARMIRAIRADIRRELPPDAQIVVISEGEPALLDLHGRRAAPFPSGPSPFERGAHPADGLAAMADLVTRQALGATHLVVPATASWWLDAYPELAERIAVASTALPSTADGTLVQRLHGPRELRRAPDAARAMDIVRRRLGREPHVLDVTRAGWGRPGAFRPPGPWSPTDGVLPYLDTTVDVVVVDAGGPSAALDEARRVASAGVLTTGADGWSWTWTADPPAIAVDVLVAAARVPAPEAYLDVLRSSLPPGFAGSVTIVAPNGDADRWTRAAGATATVTNDALGSVLAALVAASGADHVAVVDGSTIPLDGWLPALVAAFGRGPTVGAVAARRLGDELTEHTDHVVRRVDVVAPGTVVWRRDVLAQHPLDGDGPSLRAMLGRHTQQLVDHGLECLVHPDAVVADLGIAGWSPDVVVAGVASSRMVRR